MPHFGLMDEGEMIPRDAAFLRDRFHLKTQIREVHYGQGNIQGKPGANGW